MLCPVPARISNCFNIFTVQTERKKGQYHATFACEDCHMCLRMTMSTRYESSAQHGKDRARGTGGRVPYGSGHQGGPSGDQPSECACHASAQHKVKSLYTCMNSEMLSYGRHARERPLHPPDLRRLRHPSPQTSPDGLLHMATSQVSAIASRKYTQQ